MSNGETTKPWNGRRRLVSEIFSRPPTIEGARTILAQYRCESVLIVLAKLSASLGLWFRPDYE
jgi:hypothetical protein